MFFLYKFPVLHILRRIKNTLTFCIMKKFKKQTLVKKKTDFFHFNVSTFWGGFGNVAIKTFDTDMYCVSLSELTERLNNPSRRMATLSKPTFSLIVCTPRHIEYNQRRVCFHVFISQMLLIPSTKSTWVSFA